MTARLECRNLSGGRGSVTAFRDVDLTLDAGEIVALIGPNGAGKTTLLLSIAGLLRTTGGVVLVDGTPLRAGIATAASRAGIVLVPDNRCLFAAMTVEENLKAATRRHGVAPRAMLDLFPALERRWRLPASALSGGEQQMLAIARALIQQPRCLLIDEMSMGLAPLVVESLFEAVARIARDHDCAVILVEQHVHLALEVARRAVVLNRGSVVLSGLARDILDDAESLERAYLGEAASKA